LDKRRCYILWEENASQSQQKYTIQMNPKSYFCRPRESVHIYSIGDVLVNETTKNTYNLQNIKDMAPHTFIEHAYELFEFTINIYKFKIIHKKVSHI